MPTLIITADDGTERRVALPDGLVRIGRASNNDVVLPDASKGVSRSHAELRYENGGYIIVDLESQNGTWVNNRRVERAPVVPGAEIAVGLYRVRLEPAAAAPPVAASKSDIGEIPLVRPEQAAVEAAPRASAAVRVQQPPLPPAASRSAPMLALFAGGVAIGMLALGAAWMFRSSGAAPQPSVAAEHPAVPPAANLPEPVAAPVDATPAPESAPAPAVAPTGTASPEPAAAAGGPATAPAPQPEASTAAATPPSEAQGVFDAGLKLDAAGDWVGALRKFDQARELDPALPGLDKVVRQVRAKLRAAGAEALKRARAYDAIGQVADALKEYR